MESLKAVGVTFLSKVARLLLTFTTNVLLARMLLPHDFGVYKTVLSVATTLTLFTSFISPSVITLFTSKTGDKDRVFGTIAGITGAAALLVTLLAVAFSPWLSSFYDLPRTFFLIAALELLVLSFNALFFTFPEGTGDFVGRAKLVVVFHFLNFLSVPIAAFGGLLGALLWRPLAQALAYLYSLFTVVRKRVGRPRFDPGMAAQVWRANTPLMVARVSDVLSSGFLVALLGKFGPEQAAFYSVASMFSVLILAVAESIRHFGLFRVASTEGDVYHPVRKMTKYLSYASGFMALSLLLFGRQVIRLFFHDSYLGALTPLYIVTAATYLFATQFGLAVHFLGTEKTGVAGTAAIVKNVAAVLLALLLVPRMGATGAALAFLGSVVAYTLALHVVASSEGIRAGRSYIPLSLVAGSLSLVIGKGLSLMLPTLLSLLLVPPFSLAFYLLAIWLLGGFDEYDRLLVEQAVAMARELTAAPGRT